MHTNEDLAQPNINKIKFALFDNPKPSFLVKHTHTHTHTHTHKICRVFKLSGSSLKMCKNLVSKHPPYSMALCLGTIHVIIKNCVLTM